MSARGTEESGGLAVAEAQRAGVAQPPKVSKKCITQRHCSQFFCIHFFCEELFAVCWEVNMEYWSSGGCRLLALPSVQTRMPCRAAASMRSMYRATRVCLCELTNASLMGQIEQARRPAFQAKWESSAAFPGNTPNSSLVQLSAYGQSLGRFGSESEHSSPSLEPISSQAQQVHWF